MEPICYLQINNGRWCQEIYETVSRHSRTRAAQLRKAGYQVSVSSMGPQITSIGLIKLTLVDIQPGKHEDTYNLPPVRAIF